MKKGEFTLFILNKDTHSIRHTIFKSNTNYRVSVDADGKGCIVHGEWMTMRTFKKHFIEYIPLLQARLKCLGLMDISTGSPLNKTGFKNRLDIHDYGRGANKLKVLYLGTKENKFAFYPMRGNNTQAINECYDMYVGLVNGKFEDVDSGDIMWGNCGIPLAYGRIRRFESEDVMFKEFIK